MFLNQSKNSKSHLWPSFYNCQSRSRHRKRAYSTMSSHERARMFSLSLTTITTTKLLLIIATILIATKIQHAQTLQQVGLMSQPTFTKSMDMTTIKENTPIGEIVYTLEAQLDRVQQPQARIMYGIEGTKLFSVDKFSGHVKVAQPIDREQTSDTVTFQVSATPVFSAPGSPVGQGQPKLQYGPSAQITITVLILDENDNPPKIERVKVGKHEYDSLYFARQTGILSSSSLRNQIRLNLSEITPLESVIVDLIEAIDLDKASSNPLKAICVDCAPEFSLQSNEADEGSLNDRFNSSIVLVNNLIHVPRDNVRLIHVILTDGKFNSTISFEIVIEDVQNKPPQFIGSTTCIVQENAPLDKTIMTIQAVDGDALGQDDSAAFVAAMPKQDNRFGRQILYDLLSPSNSPAVNEDFKLHPLTGQLQVANRLDREAYLGLNDVLTLRVRARELTTSARLLIQHDDLYESILEKLSPYVDPSPDASSEVEITVILVDVNDNEPHWLNSSEIATLNMNKSPTWYTNLPNDRDNGRTYHLEVKENSLAGTPITTKNEMFVYDLDLGENSHFNISLIDPFKLFDVEPKQVSGFALVTLKLVGGNKLRQQVLGAQQTRLLDYENPNEKSFIIQLIATETNTMEKFTSKAQVKVDVVDVNDNVPEFKESTYYANIREDAQPGKTVLLVQATDKDEVSRQLTYSLHGRSAYLFEIGRLSGLITVAKCEQTSPPGSGSSSRSRHLLATGRPCIDYELQKSHHLMVEVSDGELSSKVPLTIFIDDASDNAPVFTLPIVDVVIEEGSDKFDPPIRIEATDVDQSSEVSYSIVEGNFEGLFSINNATGELQLTRPIRIAHEDSTLNPGGNDYRQQQLNKMTLIVQATDGVFTANGTVRIDVLDANDNAPKFIRSHYAVEINESMSPGQMVTSVRAIDSDRGNNARVSYKLQRGSYGLFEIDQSTGIITVASKGLERGAGKRRQNYTLEVVAYDHGIVSKSSTVLVQVHVINILKKAPEFHPQIQRASVLETTLNNSIIHRMQVGAITGLDPALEPDQVASSGQLIFEPGPIEALDKYGQPVASSESERLESMFSVSTNTGDVMVNSALDHDFAAFVNLTVYVSARQVLTGANVTASPEGIEEYNPRSVGYLLITVMDENSNAPIFAAPWSPQQPELNYQMLEELPVGSILTQLMASDVDSKISHFKIDPPNDYFELTSPQSGVIVNKKLIDYDTLMSKTFLTPSIHRSMGSSSQLMNVNTGNNIVQFNVYAYDSGVPQLFAKATVSVEILPINDWDCKFEQQIYEARVKENAPPDALVVQVRAIDMDYGEQHNSLRYQLIGDRSDFFNIDPRTGLITISTKGSAHLDRERLSQSKFTVTVIGRDEQQQQQPQLQLQQQHKSKAQQSTGRTCSATLKVQVEDVNDNPPLFMQKLLEITAYDTDAVDVPLVKLIVRDDDSYNSNGLANITPKSSGPINTFKIISGNINDIFNITSSGQIYATKPLNDSLATSNNSPIELRVQVKQQSPISSISGVQTSFTDECLVRVNFVKINRYGPEWRFESKSISVGENSKPGTLVVQLKCVDRDNEARNSNRMIELDEDRNVRQREQKNNSNSLMRYYIRENGTNVMETNEFKLDPIRGNLVTRVELDRETQEYYQLIVVCEDNGRPQSLESVTPLFIAVLDVDDNKPEFLVPKGSEMSMRNLLSSSSLLPSNNNVRPTISFTVEENQGKGLLVGELKAIDRDVEGPTQINYCLIEGNEFQEFQLDRVSGALYTNQTLDREKQSVYDLLVQAINDGSTCEDRMIANLPATSSGINTQNSSRHPTASPSMVHAHQVGLSRTKRNSMARVSPSNSMSFLSVKVEVLDINDNPPTFRRPVHRAGVHHRSLMNTLVTQVAAFDPDSGLNGTLSYRLMEILMYKTTPSVYQPGLRGKYDVASEQQPSLSKPIKLIQFPFRIDQQGNIYTQQLLTQYQLMSMFVLQIEASEQAEPWRTARTKLEIYVYETSSQLKIRINLHPRMVELYRSDIETLLSNATKYTAIINRARSYHETIDPKVSPQAGGKTLKILKAPTNANHNQQPTSGDNNIGLKSVPSIQESSGESEPSYSNIHLIFVDNFRIVNPNLVMEKFDLASAQLFMPQMLTQSSGANNNNNHLDSNINNNSQNLPNSDSGNGGHPQVAGQIQPLQVNEVSSLIDKIALASVQSAEYHASPSTLAGIDWLESPSVLYVTLTIVLVLVGFITFLFGCCCTSRIKDHIVKVAMDKLVKQQNLQAKINEQVLAATNHQAALSGRNSNGQEFILRQGGFMSSFDATKGCVINNNENMSILQRALESGEFLDPNYTTLNGHVNMGAHYYDDSELEQQQQHDQVVANGGNGGGKQFEVGTSKQYNDSNGSLSLADEIEGDDKDLNAIGQHIKSSAKVVSSGARNNSVSNTDNHQHHQRQRQQVPID